jgi:hypothetical protein
MDTSSEDLEEIDTALANFKTFELDGNEVDPTNFPLPNLKMRLDESRDRIYSGSGFSVIRGIDISKYSVEDSVVIYLGVAGYIGDQLGFQDRKGNLICKC